MMHQTHLIANCNPGEKKLILHGCLPNFLDIVENIELLVSGEYLCNDFILMYETWGGEGLNEGVIRPELTPIGVLKFSKIGAGLHGEPHILGYFDLDSRIDIGFDLQSYNLLIEPIRTLLNEKLVSQPDFRYSTCPICNEKDLSTYKTFKTLIEVNPRIFIYPDTSNGGPSIDLTSIEIELVI